MDFTVLFLCVEECSRTADKVPCSAVHVVTKVTEHIIVIQIKLHLSGSKCPRAEYHTTLLLVEWEVTNIDGTRALIDRRRDPHDRAIGAYNCVAAEGLLVFAVSTAKIYIIEIISVYILKLGRKSVCLRG